MASPEAIDIIKGALLTLHNTVNEVITDAEWESASDWDETLVAFESIDDAYDSLQVAVARAFPDDVIGYAELRGFTGVALDKLRDTVYGESED